MRSRLPLAAMGATLLSLPLLHPLFADPGWIAFPGLLVVLVAGVRLAGERLHLRTWGIVLAQAALLVLLITARFATTALLGFIPVPATFAELAAMVGLGLSEIDANASPIAGTPHLGLVVAIALAVVALAVDLLLCVARRPLLVGLVQLAVLFVPLSVHFEATSWLAFTLAAVGFLVVLATDSWERNRRWPNAADATGRRRRGAPAAAPPSAAGHARNAARMGAVAVVVALLLPLTIPGLRGDAVFDLASGTNADGDTVSTTHPMVSLRRELLSPSDTPILRYTTTASRPGYLRSHVLDTFDGENWTMTPLTAARQHRVTEEPLPLPSGEWDTDELTEVEVEVSREVRAMDFLPMPYPAYEVEASGRWYVDPETLMVFAVADDARGAGYTVRSPQAEATPEELDRRGGSADNVNERYLEVPDSVHSDIVALSERLTEDSSSSHEAAVTLQEWFTNGRFDYSLEPPAVPEGGDPLRNFVLETQVGYCEQFASAMAIMARVAGIPARVAVGYTAGRPDGDEDGVWVVTERNAHAWPELYFPGSGWLRFEPTPSTSVGQATATVPDYAQYAEESEVDTDDDDGGPDASGAGDTAPTEEESAGTAADQRLLDQPGTTGLAPAVSPWQAAATAGGLLAALLVPALARLLRRRVRLALARTDSAVAAAVWAELRDACLDLGLGWDETLSPRAAVARLRRACELPPRARQALDRISRAEERARYAPAPGPAAGLLEELAVARAALAATRPGGARARALLLPRSMRPQPRRPFGHAPTRA